MPSRNFCQLAPRALVSGPVIRREGVRTQGGSLRRGAGRTGWSAEAEFGWLGFGAGRKGEGRGALAASGWAVAVGVHEFTSMSMYINMVDKLFGVDIHRHGASYRRTA